MACMAQSGLSKDVTHLENLWSETNNFSPAPETPQPFHLISNEAADIEAMQRAEKNPQLIMLSDWDHLTAEEYQKVQKDTRVNIL